MSNIQMCAFSLAETLATNFIFIPVLFSVYCQGFIEYCLRNGYSVNLSCFNIYRVTKCLSKFYRDIRSLLSFQNFNCHQTCLITSHLITSIPSHPDDFQDYMRTTINNNISGIAMSVLKGYLVSKKSARLIAPQVAEAFVAHYIGDENPPSTVLDDEGVGLWGRIVLGTQKDLVYGLWEDLEPPDTSIRIDLRSGEWQ